MCNRRLMLLAAAWILLPCAAVWSAEADGIEAKVESGQDAAEALLGQLGASSPPREGETAEQTRPLPSMPMPPYTPANSTRRSVSASVGPVAPSLFMRMEGFGGLSTSQKAMLEQVTRNRAEQAAARDRQAETEILADMRRAQPSRDQPGPDRAGPAKAPPAGRSLQPLNIDAGFLEPYRRSVLVPSEQAVPAAAGATTLMDPRYEEARELARAAFEGRRHDPSASAIAGPAGTKFFRPPKAAPQTGRGQAAPRPSPGMHAPSIYHPGSGAGLIIKPPPPPPPVKRAPPTRAPASGPIKGVRIRFDPRAIGRAMGQGPLGRQIEQRFLNARTNAEIQAAAAWAQSALTQRLLSQIGETTVDDLVHVSLKKLYQAAQPYIGRWDTLPAALQHPGNLRRIYGYVIQPEAGDLVLLGSSRGQGAPIHIDELIVGLAASWRDDATPVCSLDPDPFNIAGPQRVFIAGIDRNTRFAKVMLDTDHEMKRIMIGTQSCGVEGFHSLAELMKTRIEAGETSATPFSSRFWFTPIQPAPGEVRLSADGRVVLFNAGLQLRSEGMSVREGELVAKGRPDPLGELGSRFITEHLESFETEITNFRRLHGLFDIMLLGAVLRQQEVRLDVLESFVNLRPSRVAVAETYPGQTKAVDIQGIRIPLVAGGVEMALVLRAGVSLRLDDPRMENLVAVLERRPQLTSRLGIELGIPATSDPKPTATQVPLLLASRWLARGKPDRALREVTPILRDDPANLEALRIRAMAYADQGLYRVADRDLATAWRLSGSLQYRLLRLLLLLRRGELKALDSLPLSDRTSLARLLQRQAGRCLAAGSAPVAMEKINLALRIGGRRPELLLTRAQIHATNHNYSSALQDIDESITQADVSASRRLVRARILAALGKLPEALAETNRAIKTDPDRAEAYVLRASLSMRANPKDTNSPYADLKQAEQRDPRNAMVHAFMAQVLLLEGDYDGARVASDRAITLGPGCAQGYYIRARLAFEKMNLDSDSDWGYDNGAKIAGVLEDMNWCVSLASRFWEIRPFRARLLVGICQKLRPSPSCYWLADPRGLKALMLAFATAADKKDILRELQQFKTFSAMAAPTTRAQAEQRILILTSLMQRLILKVAIQDLEAAAKAANDSKQKAQLRKEIQALRAKLPPTKGASP